MVVGLLYRGHERKGPHRDRDRGIRGPGGRSAVHEKAVEVPGVGERGMVLCEVSVCAHSLSETSLHLPDILIRPDVQDP